MSPRITHHPTAALVAALAATATLVLEVTLAPQLAKTGADLSPAVWAAAGALVLAGGALVVFSLRRRASANG